jgi:hypothetical protein
MRLGDGHQKSCIDRNFPAPNRNPSLILRRITPEKRAMDCCIVVVGDSGANRWRPEVIHMPG